MKKAVIVITLLVVLISMSSAYAIWTDSISTTVSAQSAVISAQYTRRKDNSDYISYTVQSSGELKQNNPYNYVQENVSNLYYDSSNNPVYEVEYRITNTGTVPITLDGIDVDGLTIDGFLSDLVTDTLRIEYSVNNKNVSPNYNYSTVITDVSNHTGVTFANHNNNILQPNKWCTVTVSYYRVSSGFWLFDMITLELTKTDQPICSVYR